MKRLFFVLIIILTISCLGVFPAQAQEPINQRCGGALQTHTVYLPIIEKDKEANMADNFDLWWAVIPESTTNLVTNPSAENDLTGYTAFGAGSIARSTTHQRRDLYSIKVTPSVAVTDGVEYSISLSTTTWYTFSVDVRGEDGESYVVDIYDSTGTVILNSISFVADGAWARYAVTAQTGANTTIDVRVYKDNDANTFDFYVDGFQVEQKLYATDYIDGDMDGGQWAAGAHSSTSNRLDQFSGAGRPVSLVDYGYNVGVSPIVGGGMTSVQISADRPALGDGTVFRRQALLERITSLAGFLNDDDLQSLHSSRSQLLQIFDPNRFATQQPIHLRYIGSGKTLDCAFYYQDGLGGNLEGCGSERIPLRLYAADPFWVERDRIFNAVDISEGIGTGDSTSDGAAGKNGGGGNDVAFEVTTQEDILNANYIIQKDSLGNYSVMGTGLSLPTPAVANNTIRAVVVGSDGALYVGGGFTNMDGIANADYIARWDGSSWSALGTGGQFLVWDLDIDSAGNLYAVGEFTDMGGVANTRGVAKWDGSSWSALGTGANGSLRAVVVDSNDNVYVGADSVTTDIGGVAATNGLAMWNGTAWSALSTGLDSGAVHDLAIDDSDDLYLCGSFGGLAGVSNTNKIGKWNGSAFSSLATTAPNNNVSAIDVDSAGIVYAGGLFTTIDGVSANYFAKLDGTWQAVGSGGDGNILSIVVDPGDRVYVAGGFTGMSGVADTAYIARLDNGITWNALGTGMNSSPWDMTLAPNGQLYAGGQFTSAGGESDTERLARWTGTAWRTIALPTKAIIQAVDGKIYIGGGFINAGGVANADRVAYWDTVGEDWNALSTGADGIVHALAEAPNGDIYAAGAFTSMAGVGNTQAIAYWDVSASVWLPLSTGINGTVLSLAFAPNGDLYIGGLFLDAGGVANTKNLVMWDGSAFNALSGEPNSAVNDLRFAANGNLYVGGSFTDIGGTTYDYVALYTPSTDVFSALENGSNGFVNSIDIGPGGSVYLGGTFTQSGSVAANYITCWNGTAFSPLGDGLNNVAYVVRTDSTGLVHVGGVFTVAGVVSLPDKIAVWNTSNWVALDVDLPGDAAVEAILFAPTITVFGFDTSGTAVAAKVN